MRISKREAAEYLGLSLNQINYMIAVRQIPFVRISPRKSWFIKEELDEWKADTWRHYKPEQQ